jgi:hypothetical protein
LRHKVNADDLKRRNAEYYQKNKQHIHDTSTAKMKCNCGSFVSVGYLPKHLTTKIHLQNLHDLNGGISKEQYKVFTRKVSINSKICVFFKTKLLEFKNYEKKKKKKN